jgi:Ca2+-binding RTX toxin-like protein
MANVFGSDASETLNAADGVTDNADTIFGFGGNDDIFGLDGNDEIKGGGGADDLFGGSGSDTANYSDSFEGVQVYLTTGMGFNGTAEGDSLDSIENITGSAHDDFLVGNDEANVLIGLEDNDILKGLGGDDTLYGDSGSDTLKGGGGADTLNGGSGIDTVAYNESGAGVVVSLITDTAGNGDAEGDELNSIENLTGSSHDDTLWGNDGVNVIKGMDGGDSLKGYGGNDTLQGGDGEDFINGGAGADTMTGGNDNDTYIVDNASDVVVEGAGQGASDQVRASVNYTLGAGAQVEFLRTTNDGGVTAINLTGNAFDQTLMGNAGANYLDGKGGADHMEGLGGNDRYYMDHAGDLAIEFAGQGNDTVIALANVTLSAGSEMELLRTSGSASAYNVNLNGNEFDQAIQGNAGKNVVNGRAGSDTLTGYGNDDIFRFNTALGAGNVDEITDFNVADDTIQIDNAVFAGLALGTIDADQFHIGASAADAQDRIVYNSATGALYFDSNGNAVGGAVQFATLDTGLAMTHNDFVVI